MFRISTVLLAMVSALALNGCSQCSQQQAEEAPAAAPMEAATPMEAAPVDPAAAPMEGAAAPMEGAAAPVDGAAAPTEAAPAADATPATN